MTVKHTLPNYNTELITSVKSFTVQTMGYKVLCFIII
jgi:hypothetical protein